MCRQYDRQRRFFKDNRIQDLPGIKIPVKNDRSTRIKSCRSLIIQTTHMEQGKKREDKIITVHVMHDHAVEGVVLYGLLP